VRTLPLSEGRIRRIARTVWEDEGGGAAQISIAVVGDRRMAKFTQRYTGRRYRTDVLAFDLTDPTDREQIGQIIVNCPLARERAAALNVGASAELALYLVHGLLHLTGWNDRRATEAHRMHRRSLRYLRELGFETTLLKV